MLFYFTFFIFRTNNDNSYKKNSTRSHDLMQGNYYDQTRFDIDCSSSINHQSKPGLIDINVEDYKKVDKDLIKKTFLFCSFPLFINITTYKNSNSCI